MTQINPQSADIFYQAYLEHDRSYEGIFFLGVKTTGIFCRPGCTAKTPKRENVEFFSSSGQALQDGYRPCKKCQPLDLQGSVPEWVSQALELASREPERVSDRDLQQHRIDPTRLRRWFKQHHGMTFQAYQRLMNVGRAYAQIRQGDKVIDSALDNGYSSLSGFNESFRKLIGFSPAQSKKQRVIPVAQLLTPLGPMIAAANDQGLCLLEFINRKNLQRQLERVQKRFRVRFIPGEHELFTKLQQQLDEYFNHQRQQFDIPLDLRGTDFQLQAWQALLSIPFGKTLSYQQEAESIGKPQAVRAVASANASNAIAILVPCHRVISKSGKLAGYAGGEWRKQFLLDLEAG